MARIVSLGGGSGPQQPDDIPGRDQGGHDPFQQGFFDIPLAIQLKHGFVGPQRQTWDGVSLDRDQQFGESLDVGLGFLLPMLERLPLRVRERPSAASGNCGLLP